MTINLSRVFMEVPSASETVVGFLLSVNHLHGISFGAPSARAHTLNNTLGNKDQMRLDQIRPSNETRAMHHDSHLDT